MVKTPAGRTPLIYWVEISTGIATDSFTLTNVSEGYYDVASDMSADGTRLAVSLFWDQWVGGSTAFVQKSDVYIMDLKSKVLGNKLPVTANVPRRFESKDTRLTEYIAEERTHWRTWSPSGQYNYDGWTLYDYPQKGLSTRLTNHRVDVIRWGLIDAVLLARTTNYPNSMGKVCLLDVCADSTIVCLAESETYTGVYAPITLSHAIGRKDNGTVSVWTLPDFSSLTGDRVRVTLPPSPLKTDTLYYMGMIAFPLDSNRITLLDIGDGGRPSRGPLFSIFQSGQLLFRTGTVTRTDTTWSTPFAVSVVQRPRTVATSSELATGSKAVVSARVGEDGRILVSTESGLTVILDSKLQCREGFVGPATMVGSDWDGADFIQTLSKEDSSWYEPQSGPGYLEYVNTKVTAQRIRTADFSTVATFSSQGDIRSEGLRPLVRIIDQATSKGLAFSFTYVDLVFRAGGNLYEDAPGDTLKFSSLFSNHAWQNLPIPTGGALNSTATNAVFMCRDNISWQVFRRIVSASAGAPEMTIRHEHYLSDWAMFMHDDAAVIDNAIVKFNPPQFVENMRFKGPFARSIPSRYAIAWDSGMFYRFDDNGTVRDSMIGPSKRPTCIVALSRSTIACGQADGTFRIYRDTNFALSVHASDVSQPLSATLTVSGQPSPTMLRVRTSIVPIADNSTFTLMDITGRLVGSCTLPSSIEYTLDLRKFSGIVVSGTYLLHLRTGGESAVALVNFVR